MTPPGGDREPSSPATAAAAVSRSGGGPAAASDSAVSSGPAGSARSAAGPGPRLDVRGGFARGFGRLRRPGCGDCGDLRFGVFWLTPTSVAAVVKNRRYAVGHARSSRGQPRRHHHQRAGPRRDQHRAGQRPEAGGGDHRVPRARQGPRPAGPPRAARSSWWSPSAATAPSTRWSTACCTTAPTRTRCRSSPWSPAAPPTSSPARSACPTTPWRRPARCWTRCAPAPRGPSASAW